ncbi:MAG: 30S ribosomal protein S13 [Euryarchaeota archaeon]|nr:30S ribosomal protein S13 [Euryarchaeota archaeon]
MPEAPEPPAPEPRPAAAPTAPPPGAREDFRYIVRFANTDLNGARSVVYALQQVKGMGRRVAEIVSDLAGVPRWERIGNLPEEKTEEMERILGTLHERVPPWLLNRQRDWDTGEDVHVFGPDVDLRRRDDLNRMKMIRCYKGIRHEQGQKVRGQRTRSNGRTGLTVGVTKKMAIQAAQAKKEEEGGKEKKE